jgi:predicted flap endonuclease-1-like 5' DNA nuclease
MFDGVGWAAGEIVWFMSLASLVGFAIGWIFGRWLQRGAIAAAYEAELDAQEELARKAEHRLIESNHTLDKLQSQLREQSAKVGELDAQLEQATGTIGDLEAELAAAGGSDEAFIEMKAQRDAARADAKQREAEVGELKKRVGRAETTVAELQNRLSAAERAAVAVAGLRADLERTKAGREELANRVESLESDLVDANAAGQALSARTAALESDLAAGANEIDRLEAELEAARREASQVPVLRAEVDESSARCAALEEELAASEERADRLSAELAAIPKPAPTREEAVARMTEVAERTSGGSPAPDDDLKRIHGIGPKLEQTLKGLGITSFRQIANFTADDITIVTAALKAFKGRIERDDWMASAATEHAAKYDDPV